MFKNDKNIERLIKYIGEPELIFQRETQRQLLKIEFDNLYKKAVIKKGAVKQSFIKNLSNRIIDEYYSEKYFSPNGAPIPFLAYEIVNYAFDFHLFYTSNLNEEKKNDLQRDEKYINMLANDIAEVYFTLSNGVSVRSVFSKNSPHMIYIYSLAGSVLKTLSQIENSNDVALSNDEKIILNIYLQAFIRLKNIVQALTNSTIYDAIVSWRSLHELECVLSVINSYGNHIALEYYNFASWYYQDIENEDVIQKLKQAIEKSGFDSKRRGGGTAFMQYGWLLCIDEVKDSDMRLDFKNCLQPLAGQSDRYEAYKTASQFSHSSGLFLLAKQEDCYQFIIEQIYYTVDNLYYELYTFLNRLNNASCLELLNQNTAKYHEKVASCWKIINSKNNT